MRPANLSPTPSHPELRHFLNMGPQEESDDEGAPPHHYRDEATSISSESSVTMADAVLIQGSEASDEEYFQHYEPSPILKYIPPRIRRTSRAVAKWVKGPQPPRPWKIRPFFPGIQSAPIQFLNNYFPKRKQKVALLIFFYICWLAAFSLVLNRSAFASDIPGYGSPVRIRCVDRFW